MKDENKTKAQLITELTEMRQQVADMQGRLQPLEAEKVERERVEGLMRAQRDLGLALSAAAGFDETLRLCVEAAIRVSGMDSGGLYLVDEKTGSMDLVYHQGLPPDFIKRVSHFDADSPNARRISSGEPIYTRHQELGVPVSKAKRREGLRALAVIPVSCKDRIVACLNVASHTLDEVPDFARTALETIGAQIGDAVVRSKMEETLRENEERFRTLFEGAPDAIFLADPESGEILDANPAASRLLQKPREVTIGLHQSQLHPPRLKNDVKKGFAEHARQKGETRPIRSTVLCADGNEIPVEILAQKIHIQGKPVLQGIFRDITQRARAEQASRASEQQYRTTLDSMGDAIHVIDADLQFVLISATFIQWNEELGLETDVIGRRLFDIFPFLPDQVLDEYRQVFETGKTLVTEEKTTITNREFITETRKIPVFDNGQVDQVITVIRDITDQKRAEQALSESEDMFRSVVAQAYDGISLVDEQGHVIEWNQAQEKITGLEARDVLNRSIWDVQFQMTAEEQRTPEEYARLKAALLEFLETGQAPWMNRVLEREYAHPDGSCAVIQGIVSAIKTDKGFMLVSTSRDVTERKLAEKTLRESQERYRDFIEGTDNLVTQVDSEGRITFVNNVAQQIFGLPPEECIGLPAIEFVHPDDQEKTRRAALQWIEDRIPSATLENRHVSRTGQVRNILWGIAPHYDDDGNLSFCNGIGRDITQRVRAEKLLRIQRDLGDALSETSDLTEAMNRVLEATVRIEGIDSGGVYLVDDGQTCALAGALDLVAHQGLRSQFVEDISHHPTDSPQARLVMAGEPVYRQHPEVLMTQEDKVRQSESLRAAAVIPIKVEDAEGRPTVVASLNLGSHTHDEIPISVRDTLEAIGAQIGGVIARIRAETALRESEEKYRLLVANASEAIAAMDRTGRFLVMNDAAAQTLRGQPSDFLGKTLWDVLPKEVADARMASASKVIQSGQGHIIEISIPIQGETRWFRQSTQPIRDESRKTTAILSLSMDITERKQAEQALKESNRRLETILAELRAAQEHMMQQERLAAVGQLAAGIAHEFNNILASVVLYTEMSLRTPDLPPKLCQRLETIAQQSQRATDLVQQILDFGRRAILDREPLDLILLLEETGGLLERTLPENVHLEITYGPDEYRINADASRVQQAIVNLALNARDAMPEGGELLIGLERLQIEEDQKAPLPEIKTGEWVRVSVTDTGTGIPRDVLPRIYEPFFTTRAPLGHGLGLAQVYGIVRQHEGHINVQTEVGRGTTFTLYWPALPASQPEAPALPISPLAQGQGETILVVEDDSAMRVALVDTLETLNYRVIAATNGHEALTILQKHKGEISLVLSDWVMPVMGGAELACAVKERQLGAKVLMLTGHSLDKAPKDVEPDVVVGWLQKPPSFEQLAQVIAQVLESNN